MYGFPIMAEMERNKRKCSWVAPKLFYDYGPPNSKTSLEHVERRNLYTKEADAYSVEKMVKHIWKEEWNKNLFCDAVGMNIYLQN
jgi:hypothetical protein